MILPIEVYGSPILRKKSIEVDINDSNFNSFLENLWDTMYHADGLGLAAPQVAKNIRVFVIDASSMEEENPSLKDFKKAFINPQIIEQTGEEWAFNEGCLSLPTIREDVSRLSQIRMTYYDEKNNFFDEVFDGIKARIIQHEYDHIEGKLFIDHLNPLKRKLLTGKLNAISKGKVEISYKIRIPK